MRKKNLTKKQKTYIASCGLKPNNWYIETETEDVYYLVSKIGQHRLILSRQIYSKRKKNISRRLFRRKYISCFQETG